MRYTSHMAKRFDQYCPVAHALCMVGERWSLLVVRELLRGPRRYTDLLEGLPGIGTNILASRLRDLEGAGVVQKRKLPPPAASTVYELTEYGQGLEEAVYALARWGARTLGPPGRNEELYPEWGINAFLALYDPLAGAGITGTYVLRVDDDVFTARLEDGHLHTDVGAAEGAELDAAMDMDTFFALASTELESRKALREGRVRLAAGDAEALERFFKIFNLAPRAHVGVAA
jgi:DNA-binding HxlR family transcriptional regulator